MIVRGMQEDRVSYTQAGSSPESILAFRGHILEAAWTSCCFAASLTTKQVAALLLQDFQGLMPGEQTYSCSHVVVARTSLSFQPSLCVQVTQHRYCASISQTALQFT